MGNEERLREHTDAELIELARELEERAEQFSAEVRIQMNDELRRRGLPLLGFGKSRY